MGVVTDTELGADLQIAVVILLRQVIHQLATAVDHGNQTATAVEVLAMHLEVLGHVFDLLRQHGNLDFGGAGIALFASVCCHDGCFGVFIHTGILSYVSVVSPR